MVGEGRAKTDVEFEFLNTSYLPNYVYLWPSILFVVSPHPYTIFCYAKLYIVVMVDVGLPFACFLYSDQKQTNDPRNGLFERPHHSE